MSTAHGWHYNIQGERKECRARKQPCRLRPAPAPTTNLNAELDRANEDTGIPALALLPASELGEPKRFLNYGYGFEFDYDDPYYGPNDGGVLSEEITHINMKDFLAEVHGTETSVITDDYIQYAESQRWDNPENFFVDRSWGYYNEIEVSIELRPEFLAEVQSHYYRLDNATDQDRVLPYVRGKGYPTEGKSPVEALKAQLKAENNNQSHRRVDNSTEVNVQSVQFQKIIIPATAHYENVIPSEPQAPVPDIPKIAGVVVANNDGTYTLVDGYHRTKFIRQDRRRRSATYFVLSGG